MLCLLIPSLWLIFLAKYVILQEKNGKKGSFFNYYYFKGLFYLEDLPEVVGEVEHDPLQEEDEGNPLVVRVVHLQHITIKPTGVCLHYELSLNILDLKR